MDIGAELQAIPAGVTLAATAFDAERLNTDRRPFGTLVAAAVAGAAGIDGAARAAGVGARRAADRRQDALTGDAFEQGGTGVATGSTIRLVLIEPAITDAVAAGVAWRASEVAGAAVPFIGGEVAARATALVKAAPAPALAAPAAGVVATIAGTVAVLIDFLARRADAAGKQTGRPRRENGDPAKHPAAWFKLCQGAGEEFDPLRRHSHSSSRRDADAVGTALIRAADRVTVAAVALVGLEIDTEARKAALLVGGTRSVAAAAMLIVDGVIDAVAIAADAARQADAATGATVVRVRPGIGARASAATAGSGALDGAGLGIGTDAAANGAAGATVIRVGLPVGAGSGATDFPGGAVVPAGAAVRFVGIQIPAFAAAFVVSRRAPAFAAPARGVVTAVPVAVALLVHLLARGPRRRGRAKP